MPQNAIFSGGDLDSLDCTEELTDEPGDDAGSLAAGASILLDALGGAAVQDSYEHEGQD